MPLQPAVFIGLGGAGVLTLGQLKARMLSRVKREELNRVRFLFIDTDEQARNEVERLYRLPGVRELISGSEFIDLGTVNPFAVYSHNISEFQKWVHPEAGRRFKNAPLREGAGGDRQQARVAFAAKAHEIRAAFNGAVRAIADLRQAFGGDNFQPVFYIVSGTCGGTGSSIFLDVAFLVDRLWINQVGSSPRVRAVLFMPEAYIQKYTGLQRLVYHSNAYAFFTEVNKFLNEIREIREKTRDKPYKPSFSDYSAIGAIPDIDQDQPWPVFELAFCIDYRTAGFYQMDLDELYASVAELLYWWHVGYSETGANLMNQVDNELKNISNTNPNSLFAVIGYRVLQYPRSLLEEYLVTRFQYELFRYGLLGNPYEAALPDEEKRREERERIFRDCIERYLFAEASQPDGPSNLEVEQRRVIEEKLQSLTLGPFLDARGRVEKQKVRDPLALQQYERTAQAVLDDIKATLERNFRQEPGSPVHLDRVLKRIRRGDEGKGALDDEVERAILQFGLEYAQELVRQLDVMCAARIDAPSRQDDLQDLIERLDEDIKGVEAQRESAKQQCLQGKKPEQAVRTLDEAWRRYIGLQAEKAVRLQQREVLRRLCEQGLLDRYRDRLRELADAVRKELGGTSERPGFGTLYLWELPKRFLQTRENVTVTYIPDVAAFIGPDGQWVADHRFAQLYGGIVPQQRLPGGQTEPMRYGADYGFGPQRAGLHRILQDELLQEFAEDGRVRFFQRFFRDEDRTWDTPDPLMGELRERARKLIENAMSQNREIGEELNRSVSDLYNRLSSDRQERIRRQFTGVVHAFCPMKHGVTALGAERKLFVGNNREFAQELGYDPGRDATGDHQFVRSDDPLRFMVIKFQVGYRLSDYLNYDDYERVAADHKQPWNFIARQFFEGGLTQEELQRHFARLLLYRELLNQVEQSAPYLLDRVFYRDPRLTGNEQTMTTPLLIEGDPPQRQALVPQQVRERDRRIHLRRGDYIPVSYGVNTYQQLFNDLGSYARGEVIKAFKRFDELFLQLADSDWIQPVERACEEFRRKIDKSPTPFNQELNNWVILAGDRLREHLRTKPPSGGVVTTKPVGPEPFDDF